MNEEQNGCKIECDENGCRVECGGQGVEKVEEVASGCLPSVADVVRGTKYATVEEFEIALARVAEDEKLNMNKEWKKIIANIYANGQSCPCRCGRKFPCPCHEGLAVAKWGKECFCSLFIGHNVD